MIPDAARDLHAFGASLIPVKLDKTPYFSWVPQQRTPAQWEQLVAWDQQFNPPSWAVVTGKVSGLICLDFDGPDGVQTMKALGLSPHVRTGSDGRHVYIDPADQIVRTLSGKVARAFGENWPGTDVRGEAGYAIVCGRNVRGDYVQLRSLVPPDPFEALPDDLRAALIRESSEDARLAPAVIEVQPRLLQERYDLVDPLLGGALEVARTSGRNNGGLWLTTQARDNGFTRDEAEVLLLGYIDRVPSMNLKGHAESYTRTEALATLEQAFSRPPRAPWDSPGSTSDLIPEGSILVTNRQLVDITDECVDALIADNNPPLLFVRGGVVTRIRHGDDHRPIIEPVETPMLRHRLAEAASFVKKTKNGIADTFPPTGVAANVLAAGSWPFPELAGLTATPFLRPDGTIVDDEGYDNASRLFLEYRPGSSFAPIPEEPSADDLRRACELLLGDVLGDFPFTDRASCANALGLLLTPLLRNLVDAPVPMAVVNAPQMGTGKGLLVDVVSLIAFGRNAPVGLAPGNDEEFRKRITAAFIAGDPLIVLDNLDDVLRSAALAGALTALVWTDRILGASRTVTLSPRVTWVATGNNVELGGDLARRCYLIDIDTGTARPYTRLPSEFRHPRLPAWVADHRGELVWAGLTLARGWFNAGCPAWTGPVLGRYLEWCELIGGVLEHAGIEGFLGNLERVFDQADSDAAEWVALLEAWEADAVAPETITTAFMLNAFGLPDGAWPVPSQLAVRLDRAGETSKSAVLGKALARIARRRFNERGLRIEPAGKDGHSKSSLWRVVADRPGHSA
jgi:hypothetical protein